MKNLLVLLIAIAAYIVAHVCGVSHETILSVGVIFYIVSHVVPPLS